MTAAVSLHAAVFAAVLLGADFPAPSPAQARTMQQKLEAACAPAVDRLCPEAKADPDALKACLLSHRAAVDAACMRWVDAAE